MKGFVVLPILVLLLWACSEPPRPVDTNPLLNEFNTPFGVPPFDAIKDAHYLPAFEEGMRRHKQEIDAILNESAPPSFQNTVEALETSGALLTSVQNIFNNLTSAHTNDEMQKIAKEVAPRLSKHQDDILMNAKLFDRIRAVYEQRDNLDLSVEQSTLLDRYYRDFVRGGAGLDEKAKAELQAINEEISVLTVQFGENVLKENNAFQMVIDNPADLAGLPDSAVASAAEAAKEQGLEGKWVFTLHRPSMIALLQYSERRDLRQRILEAYIERGNHGTELDNKTNASKIASLRARRAKLLGYPTHAHYVLERNMAKVPENVYELLQKLWTPALAMAKKEAAALQEMIHQEGGSFRLAAWDWWYYAEKLRREKYALDDEVLRPYFQLENVRNGAFTVANKLYGITFEERTDIPKYHPDVRAFEVKDGDGSHLGILYTDYHPRATKEGGAWMNNYREQSRIGGQPVRPVISNVCNFSKPTADQPALLTFEEVTTLFHEFGHALHGLLSNCTYEKLSGTNVPPDFVELGSQIMENWASDPEVLKMFAKHYQTGEPIAQELVDKIKETAKFNQGFTTVEYLSASFLDMDWHTLTGAEEQDVLTFEEGSLRRIGLIPEIVVRYRSPYFAHIFSGGYSAGYYSYIWAEVLDADAFQAFKERGLFDQQTALSFRENILAKGGTEEPMTLYVRFRGAEPKIDALLERKGLN